MTMASDSGRHRAVPGDAQRYAGGIEGREAELGLAVAAAVRTLSNHSFYPHETNDALVKLYFGMLQFAKNHDLWDEFVAHDIRTMAPVNRRLGDLIRKTGDGEYALTGLTDDNSRHYQLIPQTRAEPGIRRWRSPYGRVLAVSRRIGQFDLTEEEIHRRYTKPRLLGHAETMGIGIVLSDRSDNGMITLALA